MRVMEDAAVVAKPARVTHGLPKWVLSCVNHHWMSCRSFSTFCRKNEHCRSTCTRLRTMNCIEPRSKVICCGTR
jgi:hypothetical protein